MIMAMSSFDSLIQDLVIANRILAKEDVVDAYGHVSVRHPDNPRRFLIARSVAPELVTTEDIVELDLYGQPARDEKRTLYLERFIHTAIFEARPDVTAVVHAHAEDTLAFGVAGATKLRPVIHSGRAARSSRLCECRSICRATHARPVAGRDRCPQPQVQPLFDRDLARLGILGEQGRLWAYAHSAR
jgi:HCOMODA/2-hydroxy-3-carboxy-muconic semialdehyde decarboxylase